MSDPQTFFQVAASLIPAVVFGGHVSDQLKPPAKLRAASSNRRDLVGGIAAVVGGLIVLAEIFAIQASLTTNPSRLATWLVSGVLTASTAATAFVLAAPWLEPRTPLPAIILGGAPTSIIGMLSPMPSPTCKTN